MLGLVVLWALIIMAQTKWPNCRLFQPVFSKRSTRDGNVQDAIRATTSTDTVVDKLVSDRLSMPPDVRPAIWERWQKRMTLLSPDQRVMVLRQVREAELMIWRLNGGQILQGGKEDIDTTPQP